MTFGWRQKLSEHLNIIDFIISTGKTNFNFIKKSPRIHCYYSFLIQKPTWKTSNSTHFITPTTIPIAERLRRNNDERISIEIAKYKIA